MFDLVWVSSLSVNRYLDHLSSDIDVEIFLMDNLPDSTATLLYNTVASLDGVAAAEYTSKGDARERLLALMGTDLLEGLEDNPLPRSITITFDNGYMNSRFLGQFIRNMERLEGLSEIYYPKRWMEKIEYTRDFTLKIVIFLGVVITLAVILNLLYSIRLSARTRGEELLQLQLLGASKIFLAVPYIFEGILYALIAAVGGWLIIMYGAGHLSFQNIDIALPSGSDIIYFCLAASLIGLIGGYTGIRRSL
jgi:cell division transport system permease protein